MSIKAEHTEENALYFCTFTCFKWINLIDIANAYDEIYNFFGILNSKKCDLYGYVIMPNDVHLIVKNYDGNLKKHFSNGKRFLAYYIVDKLKEIKRLDLLEQMSLGVTQSDRKAGKIHQVFEDSFDANRLLSNEMVAQKLQYIHLNPLSKKWKLVDDYLLYPHSSARYYELGEIGRVRLRNYLVE